MELCRRIVLALALSGAALLGGLPGLRAGEEAGARSPELLALSPSICLALLMRDTVSPPLDCYALDMPLSLRNVAALVNPNSVPPFKPDDFAGIDLDANQMHNEDGQLFILAFVSDDEPVTFETSKGMFDQTSLWGDEGSKWVCDTQDEDCDGNGVSDDRVVVARLWPCESGNPAAGRRACTERSKPGPGTVTVKQGGRTMSLDFTVVGEPHDVEVAAVEDTIQTGLDPGTCPQETTVAKFAGVLGLPEKTLVFARAFDSEGTPITGAFIGWKTDDQHKGIMAEKVTPTIDLGDLGVGTASVLCGTDETGTVTVTGRTMPLTAGWDGSLCYDSAKCPFDVDPMAEPRHKSVKFTVVGPPARLKVTAEPARLACDGAAGSTVSATVTDAEGAAVANGNEVHFDVRVSGVATPVVARTVDGIAASTVVPLSGVAQGVPVVVTAGDVQESVLMRCEEAIPPVPPPPSPSPPSPLPPSSPSARGIMAPATGSGGRAR